MEMLTAEQPQSQQKTMDIPAVREAYRRQAPFYDYSFGVVSAISRRRTVEEINQRRGRVLEVGVGTGLSLPNFAPYLKITGIDLSPEMLAKARERVEKTGLHNVEALLEMDAANLELPDSSFNVVVAMYVLSVVPEPEKVMKELARVCAPGGEVMVINHFSQDYGARGWAERKLAPYAEVVGWHPVFPFDKIMVCPDLALIERRPMWPMGLFTLVRFRKLKEAA
jgi:phosphatidylethanolamine/phosphatidyl-N-methylethanolamine N-methyltransferase